MNALHYMSLYFENKMGEKKTTFPPCFKKRDKKIKLNADIESSVS